MGELLYEEVIGCDKLNCLCCVYVLVGMYEMLFVYFVCCLLENGVNMLFVNCIVDKIVLVKEFVVDLVDEVLKVVLFGVLYVKILLLCNLYGDECFNLMGFDLLNEYCFVLLLFVLFVSVYYLWCVVLMFVDDVFVDVLVCDVCNLVDQCDVVGMVSEVMFEYVSVVFVYVVVVVLIWQVMLVDVCVDCLVCVVDLFEVQMYMLMGLIVCEVGKLLLNVIVEICEVVDFLCYYVVQICGEFLNDMYCLFGFVVCISLWNFLFVIFMGQVVVVFVVGNMVFVKLVEQMLLIVV